MQIHKTDMVMADQVCTSSTNTISSPYRHDNETKVINVHEIGTTSSEQNQKMGQSNGHHAPWAPSGWS